VSVRLTELISCVVVFFSTVSFVCVCQFIVYVVFVSVCMSVCVCVYVCVYVCVCVR